MFAGLFSEIRLFHEILNENYDADLYIISGRYGLIHSEKIIVPYHYHLKTYDDLQELNDNTKFYNGIIQACTYSDYVCIFVNKLTFKYLINNNILKDIPLRTRIIAVTSTQFKSQIHNRNHFFYPRRGVARIGKENQKLIELVLRNNHEEN